VVTGVNRHAFEQLRSSSFLVTERNEWYCAKKECKLYIKCSKRRKVLEGCVKRRLGKCSEDKQTNVKYFCQNESSGSLAFNSHIKTYEVKYALRRSSQLSRLQETEGTRETFNALRVSADSTEQLLLLKTPEKYVFIKIYDFLATLLRFTMKEY
jgi:hypothetical protein